VQVLLLLVLQDVLLLDIILQVKHVKCPKGSAVCTSADKSTSCMAGYYLAPGAKCTKLPAG